MGDRRANRHHLGHPGDCTAVGVPARPIKHREWVALKPETFAED
jgi:hypothetical protein